MYERLLMGVGVKWGGTSSSRSSSSPFPFPIIHLQCLVLHEVKLMAMEETNDICTLLNNLNIPSGLAVDTQWNRPQRQGGRAKNASTVFLSWTLPKKAVLVVPTSAGDNVMNKEEAKCLEKIGTREGIQLLSSKLRSIGAVSHDACGSISKLVSDLQREHREARDTLDAWHTLKRMKKDAKLFESKEGLFNFSVHLHGMAYSTLKSFAESSAKDRLEQFLYFDWRQAYPDLNEEDLEKILNFCQKW
eukprot:CAMPEP_0201534770 /NCGR_PEP_ID=MMETSP0161_2-20130828/57104_1 /ASSEMBLY_ACC=CAM_ASM_000251 /TAXON_ID=180227 /ORGANISM="Neoparamoeba aestuarina, Strain SoJaBio B1-5/56/2" /LENGTH=245 /DNA_ID=CAMNT_0047939573 /DNA_START=739 /DNA_END=1473 /DNA_ORIENTATION=+